MQTPTRKHTHGPSWTDTQSTRQGRPDGHEAGAHFQVCVLTCHGTERDLQPPLPPQDLEKAPLDLFSLPPPPHTPYLRSSTKPGSFPLCLKRALNFSFLNAGMLLSSSFAQTPWWRWMGARNTVIRKIKLGLVIFLYHGAVSPTSDVLHSARMSPEPLVPVVKKTIKNTIGERVMMKFNCSRSHTWGLLAVEPGGSAASSFTAVSLSPSLRSFH